MSSPTQPGESAQKLSELIYVELVGRAFLRVESTALVKPEPNVLAKLSIQLAEAFREAERQAAAEAANKKHVGYDIRSADLGAWNK
jgi:hypothetical protein